MITTKTYNFLEFDDFDLIRDSEMDKIPTLEDAKRVADQVQQYANTYMAIETGGITLCYRINSQSEWQLNN